MDVVHEVQVAEHGFDHPVFRGQRQEMGNGFVRQRKVFGTIKHVRGNEVDQQEPGRIPHILLRGNHL